MLKNKIWFIVIMLLCFGFVIIEYQNKNFKEISINNIVKYDNITKVEFLDGRGGLNKPFILEDKEKINEFLNFMDNYNIKKEKKHIDSVGWIHMVNFYSGERKIVSITFGDTLEINGIYYKVLNGNLSVKQIDEFINSVNPSWNIP